MKRLLFIFLFFLVACNNSDNNKTTYYQGYFNVLNRSYIYDPGSTRSIQAYIYTVQDKETGCEYIIVNGRGTAMQLAKPCAIFQPVSLHKE